MLTDLVVVLELEGVGGVILADWGTVHHELDVLGVLVHVLGPLGQNTGERGRPLHLEGELLALLRSGQRARVWSVGGIWGHKARPFGIRATREVRYVCKRN